MRPAVLTAALTARFREHAKGTRIRPAYISGPPGVGKTQTTHQIATDEGVGYVSLHAPLMLNEDFGMPTFRDDGEIDFATPGRKFPFEDSEHFPETGILAVEEVAQADNTQQKIWANIFQERELHGRKLKPGWYIVATGNRMQDRAGANRILSHFNDRFTSYDFEPNLDDWANWALTHDVAPEVVSFCRWRPDLLSKFDPNQDKCPTPRAWAEGVSPTLQLMPPEAQYDTIKGDVGEGAAAEFKGFLDTYRALPNIDMVLAAPDTHPVPDQVHVCYALSGALAHRAAPDTIGGILKFATRMEPEFSVLVVRDARRVCPAVENSKAYIDWCIGPGAEILLNK